MRQKRKARATKAEEVVEIQDEYPEDAIAKYVTELVCSRRKVVLGEDLADPQVFDDAAKEVLSLLERLGLPVERPDGAE